MRNIMLNNKHNDVLPDQKSLNLHTNVSICLQTRLGQSLFIGTWKTGKMGLLPFATATAALWKAVKIDDPYAEWYLLKTYQALDEAKNQIKSIEINATEKLNSVRGVEIKESINTNPVYKPLVFSTPFGYMGAYLIADIDFVFKQLLTMKKIGIVNPEHHESLNKLIEVVQDAFLIPKRWHFTGVTREDVMINSQKAQEAKSLMGELPESVLNKKIQFEFLPNRGNKK